jgi:N-methylhydantoinase A/oxoprolinase/acetone carboxylase beta subunit
VYLHEYPETEKVEVAEMKTVFVQKPLEKDLEGIYEKIKSEGIDSVGVSFANSYIYPENEYLVKSFFEKKGFKNVYLSCENKSLGYLNRA